MPQNKCRRRQISWERVLISSAVYCRRILSYSDASSIKSPSRHRASSRHRRHQGSSSSLLRATHAGDTPVTAASGKPAQPRPTGPGRPRYVCRGAGGGRGPGGWALPAAPAAGAGAGGPRTSAAALALPSLTVPPKSEVGSAPPPFPRPGAGAGQGSPAGPGVRRAQRRAETVAPSALAARRGAAGHPAVGPAAVPSWRRRHSRALRRGWRGRVSPRWTAAARPLAAPRCPGAAQAQAPSGARPAGRSPGLLPCIPLSVRDKLHPISNRQLKAPFTFCFSFQTCLVKELSAFHYTSGEEVQSFLTLAH